MTTKVFLVPLELEQVNMDTPINQLIDIWMSGQLSTADSLIRLTAESLPKSIILATLSEVQDWLAFDYANCPFDMNKYNIRFVEEKDLLIALIRWKMGESGRLSMSDVDGGEPFPSIWGEGNMFVNVIDWGGDTCGVEVYNGELGDIVEELTLPISRMPIETLKAILSLTEKYVNLIEE